MPVIKFCLIDSAQGTNTHYPVSSGEGIGLPGWLVVLSFDPQSFLDLTERDAGGQRPVLKLAPPPQ